MTSKTRSPRGNQNKGKEGERQVIRLLQPVVNAVYEAHGLEPVLLQRNTLQSDRGGCDLAGLNWLALEVKRQEQLAVPQWWQQTLRQAQGVKTPVLFYRRNNEDWKVVVEVSMEPVNGWSMPVVATISPADFVEWFKWRLTWELQK